MELFCTYDMLMAVFYPFLYFCLHYVKMYHFISIKPLELEKTEP